MAFTLLGSASANSKAGTTFTIAVPASNFEAGRFVVVAVASDNASTTDTTTKDNIVGVTDSGGNTYTLAVACTKSGAAAQGGATVGVWYSKLTTGINSGTITITNTTTAYSRAAAAQSFSASSVVVAGTPQTGTGAAGTDPALTISGLSSQEYLFIGGVGDENNAVIGTPAGFSGVTANNTTGGQAATNMAVLLAYNIATATTKGMTANAAGDNAAVLVAFRETGAIVPVTMTGMTGSVGSATVSAVSNIAAPVTMVGMTGDVGQVTATSSVSAALTMPGMTGSVGAVTVDTPVAGGGGARPASSLIVTFTPGPNRNDFTGEVGLRFGIGGADITIQWIGIYVTTASGTRTVRLYEWFGDTVLRTATIDLAGKTVGAWVWEPITPLTMTASGYYALLQSVTASDGLIWADALPPSAITPDYSKVLNAYACYRVPASSLTAYAENISYIGLDLGIGTVGGGVDVTAPIAMTGMAGSVGQVTVAAKATAPVTMTGMTASVGQTTVVAKATAQVTMFGMTASVGTVAAVTAAPATNFLKVWTGSAWALKPAKVWSGSAWVTKQVRRWDGVKWVPSTVVTPPPFAPTDISGLNVWLDASTLGLADGATVFAWPNLASGGTAPVIETGINTMTYKTNAANGNGVVRFVGGNASHLHGVTTAANDFTMVYVTRRWGPTVGRAFSTKYPPTNVLAGFHSSMQDIAYSGNGWMNTGTMWGDSGSLPAPWKLYGLDGSPPSNMRFFANGTVLGSAANGQGLGNGYVLSSYRGDNGVDETMDCDVAEMLIYTRQLTDAERISVENYLRTKWGLP